jgi:hypothetical protein
MTNINLSWCVPNEYPNILARWKSVANKRGSVDRINLVLESESENAIIDFRLLQETQTLEIILRSVGHWIIWSVPMRDIPSDPMVVRRFRSTSRRNGGGFDRPGAQAIFYP